MTWAWLPRTGADPAAAELSAACGQGLELRLEVGSGDDPLQASDPEPIGRPASFGHLVGAGALRGDHAQVLAMLEVDVFHDDVAIEAFEQGVDLDGRHVEPHVVFADECVDIRQEFVP